MDISFLETVWFALVGVLLGMFTITGGFDFGAGISLGFSTEANRRDFTIRSIAPFWDANQVWLITAGGALFAAFPRAYSQMLSLMYTPVIILLLLLVLRVVGIEFYHLENNQKWRKFWSGIVFISSLLSAVLAGVALGAVFDGRLFVPYDGFWDGFLRLFTPLSICAGVLYAAFFAAYGAIFLAVRAGDDEYASSLKKLSKILQSVLMCVFIIYAVILLMKLRQTPQYLPHAAFGILISYVCLSASARFARRSKYRSAFVLDALFALLAIATHCMVSYPFIIPAETVNAGLDISAAASSPTTLTIMLVVAGVGVPLALAYNIYAWRVFRSDKTGNESR